MSLETVMGNRGAKALLEQALRTNRVGHAYILEGKTGVGRTTLATAFAAELLGTERPNNHPDFTVVTNQLYDETKKQKPVRIETIRCMKRDVYIRPYAGERKVYLIPDADTMQAPAQNSLLKVLEEPPPYCTLLLLAENANSFLPTILSRATVVRLQPLETEEVRDYLIGRGGITPEKATQLAILSGGSIGQALTMLEDEDAITLREETLAGMMSLCRGTYRDLYDFVRYLKQHKGEIDLILEILLGWSRDVMVEKLRLKRPVVNQDQAEALTEFCSRIPRETALQLSETTIKYQKIIGQNANYSAAVLCMAHEYWEEIHGRDYRS